MRSPRLAVLALAGLSLFAAAPAGQAATDAAADASLIDRAKAHIAAREYWATPTRDGVQAPNRAHDLRTWFEPTGVRVDDRNAGGDARLVELRLARLGRGAALAAVAPGKVTTQQGRVEIRHAGVLEWYLNSPAGLEQGFTVSERPRGSSDLVLELAVAGARVSPRGEAIVLATAAGRRLSYGKLDVIDAQGRALVARLEAPAPDRIRLVVCDAGAAYPIVIDPTLADLQDGTFESDQAASYFAFSAAAAGDVNGDGYGDVIIGAPYYDAGQTNEGAAFLFLGSASGIAGGTPLTASTQLESNQANAWMGAGVASAGDVNGDGYDDVIVGANSYGGEYHGAAFVFLGSANGIADGNPATAQATIQTDQFPAMLGFSVASAGDVNGDGYDDVIVGAHGYNDWRGAAFVFLGSAAGVVGNGPATAHARFEEAADGITQFGFAVASAGDVNGDGYADVLIGANLHGGTRSLEGAAYVYLGSASGLTSGGPETADTTLEGDQVAAYFGQSLASAGDVNGDGYDDVIVGAYGYDLPTAGVGQSEGAAFLFLGSAAGIADGGPGTADTRIRGIGSGAELGTSVASAGDVNGDGYDDVVVGRDGAAYVYVGSPDGIPDADPGNYHVLIEPALPDTGMGSTVAPAGDVNGDGYDDVLVAADAWAGPGNGAAFVFLGSATGLKAGATWEADRVDAQAGWSVASAGDVNADGYDDLIIGVPGDDGGRAFVFLGGTADVFDGRVAELGGGPGAGGMGSSVAAAGDVNGDGYGDVIVGAPQALDASGQMHEGAAFVFLGSATGIADAQSTAAHARLHSSQADAFFGLSVASAGDVNGDGYADVIVGAPYYDAGQSDEGAAFVFLGSASGIASGSAASAHARFESDQTNARIADTVASAGDVNGDGYDDVIVGGEFYTAGQPNEGAAFVLHGSATGIASGNPSVASARIESNQPYAGLGGSVASAGDVNGDGYDDVIVGGGGLRIALVFHGSAGGIGDRTSNSANARLAAAGGDLYADGIVGPAGDVNGDGYDDVMLEAIRLPVSGAGEHAVLIYLGSPTGIAFRDVASAYARYQSDQPGDAFGKSFAAGDVNGDGYDDVIVGAPYADSGQHDEGLVRLFPGAPNLGCDVEMSQASYANGESVVLTSLRFSNRGATPVQARLRLQLTLPFGITANVLDIGPSGGFYVPGNFEKQLGPVTMFTLQPGQPRGALQWRCALEDPVGGGVFAQDTAPFVFE